MAIAKRPSAKDEIQADRFIRGGDQPAQSAKRVAVVIRFSPELLAKVDIAAKRRGISRSSWVQFVASRALDNGEG